MYLGEFPPFYFYKGGYFDSVFTSPHNNPFIKGVYSKRKEFAPRGSKFFPFRVDPFLEGRQTILT